MEKFCQSCGMPMKKDPQSGGTDTNANKSEKYCSYCYQNGEFTFKGTVVEFQDFVKNKLTNAGHNKFVAWLLTRGIKRLERWRTK